MLLAEVLDLLIKAGTLGCTIYAVWKLNIHGRTLDEIHSQTNSLAEKAEAGAHAMGVQEGLRQAGEAIVEAARNEAGIT